MRNRSLLKPSRSRLVRLPSCANRPLLYPADASGALSTDPGVCQPMIRNWPTRQHRCSAYPACLYRESRVCNRTAHSVRTWARICEWLCACTWRRQVTAGAGVARGRDGHGRGGVRHGEPHLPELCEGLHSAQEPGGGHLKTEPVPATCGSYLKCHVLTVSSPPVHQHNGHCKQLLRAGNASFLSTSSRARGRDASGVAV